MKTVVLLILEIFSFEISTVPTCNYDCIGEIIRGDPSSSRSWDNDSKHYHDFKEQFHRCTQNGITLALDSSCWEECIEPRMEYTGAADCEDGFGDGDQDEEMFFRCLIDLAVSKIIIIINLMRKNATIKFFRLMQRAVLQTARNSEILIQKFLFNEKNKVILFLQKHVDICRLW